jgi:hypothetical protein
LVEAKDKAVLKSISSPSRPAYVCFRPTDDAFVIFHVTTLSPDGWASAEVEEYRGGFFYSFRAGDGNWTHTVPADESTFESQTTDGLFKGLKIAIDSTEIEIDYPFTDQSRGKVDYTLSIRRSTGRFVERFTSERYPPVTYSGMCIVYK